MSSPRLCASEELRHRFTTNIFAFERLRERGYEWFDVSYRLMAKERREPTPGAAVMIARIKESRVRAMPGPRGRPSVNPST